MREIGSAVLPDLDSEQFEQERRSTGRCLDAPHLTANRNSSSISLQSDCCRGERERVSLVCAYHDIATRDWERSTI